MTNQPRVELPSAKTDKCGRHHPKVNRIYHKVDWNCNDSHGICREVDLLYHDSD